MWYVVMTDLAKHRIQTAASKCRFSYICFFGNILAATQKKKDGEN
jgi:hypothetical protein